MISVVGGNSFKEVKRIEYTLKITLFLRFSFSCKIKNSSTNYVLTCPA
jgi:hypothetical protein